MDKQSENMHQNSIDYCSDRKPYFCSVSETCRLLGLGRTSIFALLRDGQLERAKWRRRTLVTRSSVERFAANLSSQNGGGHGSTAA